jgi:RES domain-containing protein
VRLWRISNYVDLSGIGGLKASARWHTKGRPVLYAAEHPAGALSEFLVHLDYENMPEHFQLLTIEIDDDAAAENLAPVELKADWIKELAVTRKIGDRWLAGGKSLLLRVPSVIVPEAFNVLINPLHRDVAKMRVVNSMKVPLDARFR